MLINDDCLNALKALPDNSVDSLVTDPPAGISFMGKDWDHHKGGRDSWIGWMTEVMSECHRVLKPGAHGLVWAIPRTSHWTATALENAGFEVRDVVTHLFGSGFPKSLDISKAIDKAAGKEREILGLSKFANRGAISSEGSHEGWKRASHQQHTQRVDTIPPQGGITAGKTKEQHGPKPSANHHPTVKPQKLMQYLITLITPPNGVVLDPFMGSGSTGVAAKKLGFKFIGIEREKEYLEIAEKRIG